MNAREPLSKFVDLQNPTVIQEKFGMAIGDVSRAWQDKLNQRLKPLGLSPSQWRALLYISRVPGGIPQGELARMLGSDAPTVTRLAKNLEQAGWIARHALASDARCKILHLTAKAKKVVVKINETVAQLRVETVARLSDEQAASGLAAVQMLQGFLDEV
jgi:MarR family transcriptional regulator, transcriptional regulator for hemolysin